MRSRRQHISVIVPIHNEVINIPILHQALSEAVTSLNYDFVFVFVDDGSTDDSISILYDLKARDQRVHILEFSRNFGKEAAVSAGLHAATGDAVIIMDADLQHPPKMIGQFIQKWEQGAEVVIGVRRYSNKESRTKRFSSELYYKLMNSIAGAAITPHASDYRLMDNSVVEAFSALTERNRMTRGIIDWLGFKKEYIPFVAPPRRHGVASYTYGKLMGLALHSITSYSAVPLKLAGYLGVIILLVSGPLGVFVFTESYIMHDPYHLHITGTAALGIMLLFLVGIVLACLGLIALYIEQIHIEVTNRPLYVLRKNRAFAIRNREDTDNTDTVIEDESADSTEMLEDIEAA
jgi:glycosyltransferase involved in cell wall biosynthesis